MKPKKEKKSSVIPPVLFGLLFFTTVSHGGTGVENLKAGYEQRDRAVMRSDGTTSIRKGWIWVGEGEEPSDEEKRDYIEHIARPFPKKRVFYRWMDDYRWRALLKTERMTEEVFQSVMEMRDPAKQLAGSGLYVAEDIYSTAPYGEKLMRVEVAAGYPYIDLSDPKTEQLIKTKIKNAEELYRLNPRVAIMYNRHNWWVLKAPGDIHFKPFTGEEMELSELESVFMIMTELQSNVLIRNIQHSLNFFIDSISEKITDMAKKDFFVFESPLTEKIMELDNTVLIGGPFTKRDIQEYLLEDVLRGHLSSHSPVQTVREGKIFLKHSKYLSSEEREELVRQTLSHIQTEKDLKSLQEILTPLEYAQFQKAFQDQNKMPPGKEVQRSGKPSGCQPLF